MAILAVFPQWLTNFTLSEVTNQTYPDPFSDPGFVDGVYHVLGTTKSGIDVHARLIWGARSALTLGIAANVVALLGGIILGVMVWK